MTDEGGGRRPANRSPNAGHEGGPNASDGQYLSTRGLVIVFAGLAAALVLGYLLLSKLIDISQEEDCALARRYNCGAVQIPR